MWNGVKCLSNVHAYHITLLASIIILVRSFMNDISCDSQDLLWRNPYCNSYRMWLCSRCSIRWFDIINTFKDFTNSRSKWYRLVVLRRQRSPFLKIGDILTILQSDGTSPEFREALKITCRSGAITSAVSFKNRVLIRSGPEALWMFKPISSLVISCIVISIYYLTYLGKG